MYVCKICGVPLEAFDGGPHGIVLLHRLPYSPFQKKHCVTPIPKLV